jgi:predicted ester cyclase
MLASSSRKQGKLIDNMYSALYMYESPYRELLKRSRNDLPDAIGKRRALLAQLETTEREIAQLRRLIGGIYAYAGESSEHGDLLSVGEGLKEAICAALRSANEDVTISEILGILKELQFPIEHHQNPLGSVYTTVTRLMTEGEVVAGKPKDEKKTYRWARAKLNFPLSHEIVELARWAGANALKTTLARTSKSKIGPKDLVRVFYERIWNTGELSAVAELLTVDFAFRSSLGNELLGLDPFSAYVRSIRGALAQYRCEILDCVAEGEQAFARMRFSGIHEATFRGFEPTEKLVSWMGAALFQCRDGLIAELWVLGDLAGLDELLTKNLKV